MKILVDDSCVLLKHKQNWDTFGAFSYLKFKHEYTFSTHHFFVLHLAHTHTHPPTDGSGLSLQHTEHWMVALHTSHLNYLYLM